MAQVFLTGQDMDGLELRAWALESDLSSNPGFAC